MRHYEGKVGIFDYDETQFFEDLDGCFRYCGKETDGSKINIPYGIINCCSMFIYKPITKMPIIPTSVLKTDYMFAYCDKLSVLTDFPDSIESAAYMFQRCNSIVNADIHLSTCLKNAEGLFNSCISLKTPPTLLPSALITAYSMFADCKKLETLPKIDFKHSNFNTKYMFTNCKKLKQVYPLTQLFFENLILHQPINFTGFDKNHDMFAGCNNLICDNTHKYVKKEDYVLIPHLFDSLGIEFGIWYKYFNSDKNILPLGYNAEHDLDTLEHRFQRAFL